jgi:hypothetical protein
VYLSKNERIEDEMLKDIRYFISSRLNLRDGPALRELLKTIEMSSRRSGRLSIKIQIKDIIHSVRHTGATISIYADNTGTGSYVINTKDHELLSYPSRNVTINPTNFDIARMSADVFDMLETGKLLCNLVAFLTTSFAEGEIDDRYYSSREDFENLDIIDTRTVLCGILARGTGLPLDMRQVICRAIWNATQTIGFKPE